MERPAENVCIAHLILKFLEEEYKKPTTSSDSKESLEVAMQCLETAFGVTASSNVSGLDTSLREMFNRTYAKPDTSKPNDVDFGEEYVKPAKEVTDADRERADNFKNEGNEAMKNMLYDDAIKLYSKAIEIDGGNAVYFCNRAAAYLKTNASAEARRDCQIALQLQPNYARAYGRLGVLNSNLGNYSEASKCYRKALTLEPGNESYANNLKLSEQLAGPSGASIQNAREAVREWAANNTEISAFLSSPNLVNMATEMLRDPNLQQMMEQVINDISNSGFSNSAGFNQIFNLGQNIASQIRERNPNLVDQLNEQVSRNNGNNPPQDDGGSGDS